MFADGFNAKAALAFTKCPRCSAAGLIESDHEAHFAATPIDRDIAQVYICPSVY